MPILYNCHHSGNQYRITKFDHEMNVVSSYLCSLEECDCPRGPHPTCRHRQMLPKFIAREHVGDEWFLDFDRGGWVQQGPEWAQPEQEPEVLDEAPAVDGLERDEYLQGIMERDLPEGVTAIVMDHPDKVVDVHNAIADAVGEPTDHIDWDTMAEERLGQRPPAPTHIKRRL